MAPNEVQRRQDGAAAAASAPAANNTLYLAIGVGVGVLIIFAITGVAIRIVLKKKQHEREVAQMEQGAVSAANSPSRNMEHLPRLATGLRCSQMMPTIQQEWNALASTETVNEPTAVAQSDPKRLRSSMSLPKKFKNRGIQLGRNKYLSAIVELESPISERTSPALPQHETMDQLMAGANIYTPEQIHAAFAVPEPETIRAVPAQSSSPSPEVKPSFATRSPEVYKTTPTNTPTNKSQRLNRVSRSASAGVMDANAGGLSFGQTERNSYGLNRPESRGRSLSLGAPTSLPPSGPVPPIPVRSPARLCTEFKPEDKGETRQEKCISHMSSSSIDSASSSVLVTSPILTRSNDDGALHSPTLEDVVAGDGHASLKAVSNRKWQNPRITGPRPTTSNSTSKIQKNGSVHGSIIRFSSESALTRKLSSGSTSSEGSIRKRRISVAQLGTASSIIVSRVSSSNSLHGSVGGVQKVSTPPRKIKRQSSVSASGSPAERRRAGVLKDISGNASRFTANRESSDSTLNSGRSSCGNPFQWDPSAATLNVPSALKGSPNARKGHRRQNCVRISTLTPQVLGPAARSRSSSPAGLMHRIKEERESDEFHRAESESGQENETPQLKVQKGRRPNSIRQNGNSTQPGDLRIQTLRASFTPDSPPTASKASLTPTASDSNLSVSPDGSRADSRQSDRSSGGFVIPKFPTPSKARASIAAVNHEAQPLPEFSMDFASDEHNQVEQPTFYMRDSSSDSEPSPVSPCSPDDSPLSRISQVSPIAFQLPSSPPTQATAKNQEYDPAWPVINIPLPGERGNEYDPASPPTMTWDSTDPERSSWFLPFAAGNMFGDGEQEPKSRNGSLVKESTPPLSPRSPPRIVEEKEETLTSSNASKMMSCFQSTGPATNTVSSQGALGLSSIPILLPPPSTLEDPAYQLPEWKPPAVPTHVPAPRPRRTTSTGSPNRIQRRRRSPSPSLPTIPQSSSPPQAPPAFVRPLNLSPPKTSATATGPKGPRGLPAKSVLNNVSALRRMNSAANDSTPNRQSRNWQRLGREPSPLLPFTGTALQSEESSNSLFDFDFGSRTSEQATQGGAMESEPTSAVDEERIDIRSSAFDRVLDGALAGLEAEFERWSPTKELLQSETTQTNDSQEGKKRRKSSVWDDGEQFWSHQSNDHPSYKVHPAEVTPRKSADATCDPRMLTTSPSQRSSMLMSSPATTMLSTTPKSLYDADGFLKA